MKYSILFLDVDGTLKQEPDGISANNRNTIQKACKEGKKITIASGRNRNLIMPTIRELHLDEFGDSYTIALNGAHIIENTSGRTLHVEQIPLELTEFLFRKAYELELTCHVYTENYVYFNYRDFQFQWYQKEGCNCTLIDMDKPKLGLREAPLKFYTFSNDPGKLVRFKEEAAFVTANDLNAEYSSKNSLEYTSIKASKGLGMEHVCSLLGIPLSMAIAAGDGENDISMISKAGLGIAMQNALDSVKAAADTVTLRTCREDGVTEIIEEYLLKA